MSHLPWELQLQYKGCRTRFSHATFRGSADSMRSPHTFRFASRFAPPASSLTRRQVLQGALAFAASSLLPGCGSSSPNTVTTTPPQTGNPQPTPGAPITSASLSVTATAAGSIGPAFAGLSYEKGSIIENPYLFTGANSNLIALLKLLGPSILRIGGNSVDRNVWTPNGTGQITGQIAPNDVNALAAFVKATGWQCLYGINLGGAGPNPYTSGSLTAATTTPWPRRRLPTPRPSSDPLCSASRLATSAISMDLRILAAPLGTSRPLRRCGASFGQRSWRKHRT
ncbi:hypothetical protein SBA5_110051 [Candidatus Sulfotelmatomonas gaucii]|uniref:Uncharacterized protein n=1 Tax=Candidatus Sulfuritelmatomonas gaucii TaxID=2043161 RepID=A0A2N9L3A4_9BACT|nr:hypothetical protein SBA5_110051 [Candidatus Sulfotelmatomonas gaucii]